MKAKLRGTTGMPFDVIEVSWSVYEKITGKEAIPFVRYYVDEEGMAYKDTELDFDLDPPHPEATISGWVARNASGKILFFKGKEAPNRPKFEQSPKQWHGSASPDNGIPIIPQSAFPSLTWESDPLEVEIVIKPKNK